jgi:hypothetical protein
MCIAELKHTIPGRCTPDAPGNTLEKSIIGIGIAGAGIACMDVVDGSVHAAKTAGIFLHYQIGICAVDINTQAECDNQITY